MDQTMFSDILESVSNERRKPSTAAMVFFAIVTAAIYPLIPLVSGVIPELAVYSSYLLVAGVLLFSAGCVFVASGDAPLPVFLIPFAGVGASFITGGVSTACAGLLIAVVSYIAGRILLRGGDFHRALTVSTAIVYTVAVVAIAVVTFAIDLSAKEFYDMFLEYFKAAMNTAVSMAATGVNGSIPLDTVKLLTTQYDLFVRAVILCLPAVLACMIELAAVIVLRINGILHTAAGSTLYPMRKRYAKVDRIFAVLYLVSVALAFLDTGVIGICAMNVFLILMIPAICAGVTEYRRLIRERRMNGMRGLPFQVILLIIVSFALSPAAGVLVLSLTGALAPLKKKDGVNGEKH